MTLLTLLQSGGVPTSITADLNVTLGSLTLSSDATVSGAGITADLNVTLGALALSSAATVAQPPITADLNVTLGALTLVSHATVPVGEQTRGDDAPARTEDIRRIAKREKRRQRLEDERGRRFRQALQAAYEAAEGLAETEAPSARLDVQEALADAQRAAPEDFRAEIAALDRQARDLATIDRISALLGGIAELQARAWADDDDLTVLLMVM